MALPKKTTKNPGQIKKLLQLKNYKSNLHWKIVFQLILVDIYTKT